MATWNSSFQQTPKAVDSPTQGDDSIRGLASAVEERIRNEHTSFTNDSTSGEIAKDWLHKPGTAVTFIQSSAPATRLSGENIIAGMLWYDTDTDVLYICTTGGATPVWTEIAAQHRHLTIQGSLATGTDLLPVILFPRACTIIKVSMRVKGAPAGSACTIDLNVYNSSGVLQGSLWATSTPLSIPAGSYAANTTSMGTYDDLEADWYMTFDLTSVGSGTAATDLSLAIVGA
jgi:hypothetical protein